MRFATLGMAKMIFLEIICSTD